MHFESILPENERFVDAIYAGDEAQYWVHYNGYWKDNARNKPGIEARLITVDGVDEPVGFIAYGQHYQDEELTQPVPGSYEVIHLVIDVKHQRKGYGREATLKAMELLKGQPDCEWIVIAYNPNNHPARKLYESLGFVEFARNYDDDPLMRLKV
jgi:diamine N-acetyltransferase